MGAHVLSVLPVPAATLAKLLLCTPTAPVNSTHDHPVIHTSRTPALLLHAGAKKWALQSSFILEGKCLAQMTAFGSIHCRQPGTNTSLVHNWRRPRRPVRHFVRRVPGPPRKIVGGGLVVFNAPRPECFQTPNAPKDLKRRIKLSGESKIKDQRSTDNPSPIPHFCLLWGWGGCRCKQQLGLRAGPPSPRWRFIYTLERTAKALVGAQHVA